MPTTPSRDRTERIDEVRRYAQERLTPEQQRLFETFVGQYYRACLGDDSRRGTCTTCTAPRCRT